jgi:hypothetical protein
LLFAVDGSSQSISPLFSRTIPDRITSKERKRLPMVYPEDKLLHTILEGVIATIEAHDVAVMQALKLHDLLGSAPGSQVGTNEVQAEIDGTLHQLEKAEALSECRQAWLLYRKRLSFLKIVKMSLENKSEAYIDDETSRMEKEDERLAGVAA